MKSTINPIKTVPVPNCVLCGSTKRRFLFKAKEHEYQNTTDQEFDFYRCLECEIVYLDPRPASSEFSRIYPPNYYSQSDKYSSPAAVNLDSIAGRALHRRLLGRVSGNLNKHLKLNSEHRFLDVGCGGGKSLGSIHLEYGCSCLGIDSGLSPELLQQYEKPPIRLRSGDFLTSDFGTEKFDVIYASHLIEHLADPKSFLKKASELLNPGGLCVIETPNEDCAAARFFGRFWGGNHTPRHWFLMNPKSAVEVLKFIPDAHLQMVEIRFSHSSAFWIWSLHSFLENKVGRPIADFLFPSDQRIISTSLPNLMRHAFFTVLDTLVLKVTGRTGNMSVIYQKTI